MKTKDTVVVRGAGKTGEAEPRGCGGRSGVAGKGAGIHREDRMTDKDRDTETGRRGRQL